MMRLPLFLCALALSTLTLSAASCGEPSPSASAGEATFESDDSTLVLDDGGLAGVLRIAASETLVPLVEAQAALLRRRYPALTVEVLPRTSRGALVAFLRDSVGVVVVDRPMNEDEASVLALRAKRADVSSNAYGFGALALVVHPSNPVDSVSRVQLARLVRGAPAWASVVPGGPASAVELAATGRNSGLYELLATRYAPGGDLTLAHGAASQADVMRTVAARPSALGVVSLEALRDTVLARSVKVLAVSDTLPAIRPGQGSVYRQEYPLRYAAYLYVSRPPGSPESAFARFVRTTPGQRVVQEAGLVPAETPAHRIVLAQ